MMMTHSRKVAARQQKKCLDPLMSTQSNSYNTFLIVLFLCVVDSYVFVPD